MKIKIFLIFFILSFARISFSQVFSGFGFKTGLVSAFHSERRTFETNTYSTNSRLGLTFGIFGEFLKSNFFSSMLEIDFIQKGEKLTYPVATNNYSTLNLLSLPLFEKFAYPFGLVHPYIAAGPRIDILINKNDGLYQGQYSNINPVNFGISVSAGSEIEISKKNSLILEAVYSPDITTYEAQLGNILDNRYLYRNISFEFKLGLKFNR
jgi:hypothetical protein